MLTVEAYRDRVLALVHPLPLTSVPLADALGLVLASDVRSPRPMPGFDNSSMDGYAVRAADCAGGKARLRVIEDLPAGSTSRLEVSAGTAARIMTGAPMPAGADCVVPVERTDGGTDMVTIDAEPAPGDCVRRAGEDLAAGTLAVASGAVLTSRNLGLVASCDLAAVPVVARPRVAVMTTGSELVPPGNPVGPGQVVDSNGTLLTAALQECGASVQRFGPVVDEAGAFAAALDEAARSSDLILTSGGVSMGAYDTVKEVLSARGGVEFMKVAMQPGMPQGCGSVDGTPIITLPGNPVSTFVSFEVFVRPAVRRLAGHAHLLRPERTARITESMPSPANKVQFARGVLSGYDRLEVTPVGGQGSHIIGGLAQADCLIVIPAGVASVEAGSDVVVLDLRT